MQSSATVHDFNGVDATRRRQLSYTPQYTAHQHGTGQSMSYTSSTTGSTQSPYHTSVPGSLGSAPVYSMYGTQDTLDRNGWQPHHDQRTHTPYSPTTYLPEHSSRQNYSRSDAFYPPLVDYDTGHSPILTQCSDFGHSIENHRFFSGYPSHSPTHGHPSGSSFPVSAASSSTSSKKSRCEWGGGGCAIPLDDPSPSGIARHLRAHHSVPVTDNHRRDMCLWGAGRGCGKDMFPSSFGKHIAECHLRNMTKTCPHCGADFARADTLSRHIKAFCHSAAAAGAHAGALNARPGNSSSRSSSHSPTHSHSYSLSAGSRF